jgi:membrane protease YdiL (CAAX protease family)
MFRALPIGCLKAVWEKDSIFANTVILLLTSLLFVVAHIHFGKPLLSQWYGLILVFIHGLMYGMVYLKSKSIVYPMVMHSVSNFISVGGCYMYMALSHII